MAFEFSLQEVLDHRERVEEIRQSEMAAAQREVNRVESLVAQARQRRAHYRNELNEKIQAGVEYAYQQLYMDYLKGVDNLLVRSAEHLVDLRKGVELRREQLVRASRDRQVLDELRKDEEKEYLLAERRVEGKEYDEIAMRNFLQAQREESAHLMEESTP
jgi:flagellar FliJ protein